MSLNLYVSKMFIILIIFLLLSCVKTEKDSIETDFYIYKGFSDYSISDNLLIKIYLIDELESNILNMDKINITCTIENNSFFPEYIIINYDTEIINSPPGFLINIVNEKGNVMANEFSMNLLSSHIYREDEIPWKKKIINPYENITINIKLIDIIGNYFVKNMKKGKYIFSIVYINNNRKFISNKLEINIH